MPWPGPWAVAPDSPVAFTNGIATIMADMAPACSCAKWTGDDRSLPQARAPGPPPMNDISGTTQDRRPMLLCDNAEQAVR